MKHSARLPLLLAALLPLVGAAGDWDAASSPKLKTEQPQDLLINDRQFEVFEHGVKPEWGYAVPQQDILIVVHPKTERKNAPLYVVLHSAGHDVYSALRCSRDIGNHDIYRSPDDFYALYLDCRAHGNDWWWGGMHRGDATLIQRNAGGKPMPVEKRVIDCIHWAIEKYGIDTNRVYLSGNSMGASGTLGIGLPNGDLFAAIKANVPAGIEHVSDRMGFPPYPTPDVTRFPDPPIVIDYSGQNDGWSVGHDLFYKAMNDRKYPLYFYWGPFGHANNHAEIEKINDLVNSFDWLNVRKNEAYPVFANASSNDLLPWPDDLKSPKAGQVNAFFRWKDLLDKKGKCQLSLFLLSPAELKTRFVIPTQATADVTLRRIQHTQFKPGDKFKWSFGGVKGKGMVDPNGLVTIPRLKIEPQPQTLTVSW